MWGAIIIVGSLCLMAWFYWYLNKLAIEEADREFDYVIRMERKIEQIKRRYKK